MSKALAWKGLFVQKNQKKDASLSINPDRQQLQHSQMSFGSTNWCFNWKCVGMLRSNAQKGEGNYNIVKHINITELWRKKTHMLSVCPFDYLILFCVACDIRRTGVELKPTHLTWSFSNSSALNQIFGLFPHKLRLEIVQLKHKSGFNYHVEKEIKKSFSCDNNSLSSSTHLNTEKSLTSVTLNFLCESFYSSCP